MTAHVSHELEVDYEETGFGPPLILLHAFPQTNGMWRQVSRNLSSHFRVLCPNLRGFGDSNRTASTTTIDGMADDIAAWLEHLQIKQAIIGGLSMGGYVALALARRHPQLLRGLILAGTRADADSDEARAGRETMIAFAQDHTPREVFLKMAPRLFCSQTLHVRPELVDEALGLTEDISKDTVVSALQALRDRSDSRHFLPGIQVPTLVLVGEHDMVSPVEHAREMAEAIPNSHLQVLAGAGHFAHLENHQAFNAAILEWAQAI